MTQEILTMKNGKRIKKKKGEEKGKETKEGTKK